MKYLIVNADDFGMCRAANAAVMELFTLGRLHSSTVMMTCPGAEEAVQFSIDHPEYPIGVHLTLTSEWKTYRWKPLTEGKTLVDEEGFFWKNAPLVEKNASLADIDRELRAQIDKALAMGMHPSHLDNHMGTLYGHHTGRFSLLKKALEVCGDYGYSYRMFLRTDKRLCPAGTPYAVFRLLPLLSKHWAKKYNVILPDYLIFPDWGEKGLKDSYEHYRERILEIWTNIPDGVTETFVHPSHETQELKAITGNWRPRVWEYELLKDPQTQAYLLSKGVQMISYRDLVQMKSK